MIARKVEEILAPLEIEVNVVGLLPTSVETYIRSNHVDFVVTTSPIPGTISVPVIKGVALLTGFSEDTVIDEIRQTAKKLLGEA
jgi:PTS system galactitol-specific IIB component